MTIAFTAIGAKSAGGTSTVSVAYPSGVAASRIALAFRATWTTAAQCDPSDESGWSSLGELAGGNNGGAADNHTSIIRGDSRILTGSESGSVSFDQAGTPGANGGALGVMAIFENGSGGWGVAAATGDDATHGANRSVVGSTNLELAPGDVVVAAFAIGSDALAAATGGFSASGITFGTVTMHTASAGGVTTGLDGNVMVMSATVTAGSGTVAVTATMTVVTQQSGPAIIVRLRELTITPQNAATAQATGSGADAPLTISTVSRSADFGGLAGVVVTAEHRIDVGDIISVNADAPDTAYNGTFTVLAVFHGGADGYAVVYANAGSLDPVHAATGTLQKISGPKMWLTQDHQLAAIDAAQGQTLESPALTQVHQLTVAELAQGQTLESPTITVAIELTPAELAQGQILESPALTQAHVLTVAELEQSQLLESPALTQAHVLTPAELEQSQTTDTPTLTQAHQLTVAELAQGQTLESPVPTQVHQLTVADLAQGQTLESPTLSTGPGIDSSLLPALGEHDRHLTATGTHEHALTATGSHPQ